MTQVNWHSAMSCQIDLAGQANPASLSFLWSRSLFATVSDSQYRPPQRFGCHHVLTANQASFHRRLFVLYQLFCSAPLRLNFLTVLAQFTFAYLDWFLFHFFGNKLKVRNYSFYSKFSSFLKITVTFIIWNFRLNQFQMTIFCQIEINFVEKN